MAYPLGNLPSTGQKQALSGSTGSPATGNEYITKQRFTPTGITPDGTFDVVVDGAPASIVVTAYGTAAPAIFRGRSARGTLASPTASQSGDLLASFSAKGYGATAFATNSTGRYGIYANENWSDTAQGTKIQIETTSNTTITRVVRAIFTHDGRVVIGATEAATVPALKANSTALEVKLGDDSAYTTLAAGVLKLPGSTSGNITIKAPAIAGTQDYTLPLNYGTGGFFLQSDGLGGLTWASAAGTVTNLQTAYNGGNTISVVTSPIAISNSTDSTNLITLSRTFSGGGTGLTFSMGATTTGNAIDITLANGSTGAGVTVTSNTPNCSPQFEAVGQTDSSAGAGAHFQYFGLSQETYVQYTNGSGLALGGQSPSGQTTFGIYGSYPDGTSLGGTLALWTYSGAGTPQENLSITSGGQTNLGGTHTSGGTRGALSMTNKILNYNSINTTGWGTPAIYGTGRSTGQTASVPTVATYTVGASDGSFLVSANVNVTAYTAGTFTTTVDYTDETNTPQTLTLNFSDLAGTLGTTIAAAGVFEGLTLRIRAKAATSITVATVGTFTTLTYNVEADITQVA